MVTVPLNPVDRFLLQALLLRRPAENLVPLGVLAATGLSPEVECAWTGAFRGRAGRDLLAALLCMGRLPGGWAAMVPAGDPEGCRRLGESARGSTPRFVLAPRPQADAFWEGLGSPPTRAWSDHRLYLCNACTGGPRLTLRRAELRELDRCAEIALQMEREDMGAELLAGDERAHREDVRRKIGEGRVLVAELDGEIVFKGDIGLVTGRGGLVGGLWVHPARRGQGLGQAGVRSLTERVLRQAPLVGLHVREDNLRATGAYRAVGYREDAPFRLVVSEP